jgi:hypothetical protein
VLWDSSWSDTGRAADRSDIHWDVGQRSGAYAPVLAVVIVVAVVIAVLAVAFYALHQMKELGSVTVKAVIAKVFSFTLEMKSPQREQADGGAGPVRLPPHNDQGAFASSRTGVYAAAVSNCRVMVSAVGGLNW